MMYSVWNQGDRAYDYYQTPNKDTATSAPKPNHIRSSKLGVTPERAAWPLPPGAVKVGRGKYPKGYIASRASIPGLPQLGDIKLLGASAVGVAIWLALGYVGYKALEKAM